MKKSKKHGSADLVYLTFLGHIYIYMEGGRGGGGSHTSLAIMNYGGQKVRQLSIKRCKKVF